jgi:hypothetical protein
VNRSLVAALVLVLAGCRSACARDDDGLEDNDTFQQATKLEVDKPIDGRANEDDPDVFVVDAPEGKTLTFALTSRGLEEGYADFCLFYGDEQALLFDGSRWHDCAPEGTQRATDIATVTQDGRDFVVATHRPGRYFLSIIQGGEADNQLPFSWDYTIVAHIQ